MQLRTNLLGVYQVLMLRRVNISDYQIELDHLAANTCDRCIG